MADVLPRRWLTGTPYSNAVVLRLAGEDLVATLRRGGADVVLGAVEPGGAVLRRLQARRAGPVVLALPPAALLQQQVSLPLAAERALGSVLGHEMDRLTPFRPGDLFWIWRVHGRDRTAGRLLVQLLLVPKSAVAALLAAAEAVGLRPAAIEVATSGAVEHLPLTPPGATVGRRLGATAAAVLCAALVVALAGFPVLRQERAISRAERTVAELRPRIAALDDLRRRVTAKAGGSDLFATEHARVGSPLGALAAVTAALPDDTYLTTFAIRQRAVSLTGRSAAAVKLIGLLAADPALHDPAFDAPVTRMGGPGGNQLDQFSIRVSVAP